MNHDQQDCDADRWFPVRGPYPEVTIMTRNQSPSAGDLLALLSILAVVATVFWFYGLPLVAQFLIASKAFLTS